MNSVHWTLLMMCKKIPSQIASRWIPWPLVVLAGLGLTTVSAGIFSRISNQGSGESENAQLIDDHRRLYQETREMLRRLDANEDLSQEELRQLLAEIVRTLRLIEPEEIANVAKILPLSEVLEEVNGAMPEIFAQTRIMTAALDGGLWTVHLRDPRRLPPGAIGDDTLFRLFIDGFSGRIITGSGPQ